MTKRIFFSELTALKQAQILDSYGVDSAAELGLDKEPYMTIKTDCTGDVELVELFEPAF